MSNAEAERCFSCQNRIKTPSRNALSIEVLDKLIRLSKTPREDFDYNKAAEIWDAKPRRYWNCLYYCVL